MFIPWNILFEVLNPILDAHNLYTCVTMYIHPYTQFGSIWMVNAFMFDHYTPKKAAMPSHHIPSIPGGHPRLADCYGPGVVHCQHGAAECFANRVEAGWGGGKWVGLPFWEEIPWWIMVVNHCKAPFTIPDRGLRNLGMPR